MNKVAFTEENNSYLIYKVHNNLWYWFRIEDILPYLKDTQVNMVVHHAILSFDINLIGAKIIDSSEKFDSHNLKGNLEEMVRN